MSIFLKPVQSSIKAKDGKKKWHPRIVKVGKEVTTTEIAKNIAMQSSLTPGDVENVLTNLTFWIDHYLTSSKSVKLNGLGTFTLFLNSGGNGVDNKEEVSAKQINGLRVRFIPEATRPTGGSNTRSMLNKIDYAFWGDPEKPDDEGGFNPSE